jgi:OOP family OmpA-OmpF porin
MPRIPFVAFLLAAVLSVPAFARDRGHHPAYRGHGHHYGGVRAHVYPRHYAYLYPAPIFGYAFDPGPFYAPPVYVEPAPPAYIAPAPYLDEPPPPAPPVQREYRERSYAQIDPNLAPPAPAPQPAPAPAFDRITLSATELFAFDQATLRSPQPKLDEIARALIENPSVGDVTITGYTDRLGSDAYNLELSQRRADAVKQYLVRQGVSATRLKAVGRGKANPVVECHDKDRQALIRCLEPNRRVEVERITIERAVAPRPR